jgi:GPH family glycoside/pentoside/hexuronide:cation symporter
MSTISSKLSVGEKVGYGLGDMASHFAWDMVGMWLLWFYTDVYGIPAVAAGTIMLAARFWDAIIDPVIGLVSDRTNTRWGKFRPYLLWMALPYSLCLVFLFTTPDFGMNGKIAYAAILYILLSTIYALINLPYSSLAGVMTLDSSERTVLNSYRFVFGFFGMLIVGTLTVELKNYFTPMKEVLNAAVNSGMTADCITALKNMNLDEALSLGLTDSIKSLYIEKQKTGVQSTVILYAIISFILFLVTFFSTRERIPAPKGQHSSVLSDLKNVIKVRAWVILFFLGIFLFILIALQSGVTMYFFKYYVQNERLSQLFNFGGIGAIIVGILFTDMLVKRWGKRNVFLVCSIISGIFHVLLYLPDADNIIGIISIHILSKLTIAPTIPLLWVMIADTADYSEWKTGTRATGLFFSASTFAQKAGYGIGGFLTGIILTYVGFKANEVQTDTSILGIRLMFSLIPGCIYLLSALLLFFYNIDEKTSVLMKQELLARKEKERQ